MNENIPKSPITPGVFQGTPDAERSTQPPTQPMRTMRSDIANAIKDQKESVVSIALAEEKKKTEQAKKNAEEKAKVMPTETPVPKKANRFVVLLIALFVVGGIGFSYQYFLPKLRLALPTLVFPDLPTITLPSMPSFSLPSFGGDTATPSNPAPITTSVRPEPTKTALLPSIIPAQTEKRIITNRQSLAQIVADISIERTKVGTANTIENLYFGEEITGADNATKINALATDRFFSFVGIPAPEALTRTLEPSFMVGLFKEDGAVASTPFIVLKVTNYEVGLAGMLEWERSIPRLFDAIFATKTVKSGVTQLKLRNTVVLGHDTRILETSPDNGVGYVFANPQTIVIAGSQSALEYLIPLVK